MRLAARTDANQKTIVDILRRNKNYSVEITSQLGNGFPDIVVGAYNEITVLVEIKDPAKPLSKRKLIEKQIKFKEQTKCNYIVAYYAEEIILYIESKLR